MASGKGGRRGAGRSGHGTRRPRTPRRTPITLQVEPNQPDGRAGFLDHLWDRLRQGARNVAGVSFQLATTADLLVAARARLAAFPAVVSVVPEGLEDIDCDLADGGRLLVQTKERGPGGRPVGIADVAQAIPMPPKR